MFVICCVIFDDELEAEKTAVAIKELRRGMKFPDSMEFKFSGSSYETRTRFLSILKPYNFEVRVLVVDKAKIKSPLLKNDKQSFYGYFVKTVLHYSAGKILNAKIRIDGSGDRIFRKRFLYYLRSQLNSPKRKIIQNVRLVNSKNNVLIQMSDMIAGTVRRYKENDKADGIDYWNLIRKKVVDCWNFK